MRSDEDSLRRRISDNDNVNDNDNDSDSILPKGSGDRSLIRFCLERVRGRVPDPSSFKIDMKCTDIRSLPSPACP